ncbi:hypothetical protein AB0K25_00450 [Micromonospora sp. NPDC049257]|uniref:hypothetical protein n=1 Tax=Micromonospora sp. NPDC049257 TaxID=3155771 RepID=UPI00342EED08
MCSIATSRPPTSPAAAGEYTFPFRVIVDQQAQQRAVTSPVRAAFSGHSLRRGSPPRPAVAAARSS